MNLKKFYKNLTGQSNKIPGSKHKKYNGDGEMDIIIHSGQSNADFNSSLSDISEYDIHLASAIYEARKKSMNDGSLDLDKYLDDELSKKH